MDPSSDAPPLRDREILIATPNRERLQRVLDGHRLTLPRNVAEAETHLRSREFALVVLGVHFDESRMFDPLRMAFINMNKFPDDDEGNGRLRRIIDYLILIDGDMHGGFKAVHRRD